MTVSFGQYRPIYCAAQSFCGDIASEWEAFLENEHSSNEHSTCSVMHKCFFTSCRPEWRHKRMTKNLSELKVTNRSHKYCMEKCCTGSWSGRNVLSVDCIDRHLNLSCCITSQGTDKCCSGHMSEHLFQCSHYHRNQCLLDYPNTSLQNIDSVSL